MESAAVEPLLAGELEVLGRLPWSSNATFLGRLTGSGGETLVVYKPRDGERPLWDFDAGTLCVRELAAYEVSEASGWTIVPTTVLREGPFGVGMVQRFVDHDPDQHYLELRETFADRFREFAAFDVVINNADRKAGHCVLDATGHVWGVDHGVAFHVHPKLRTVIWDYAGEPLGASVVAGLERIQSSLDSGLSSSLQELLAHGEVEAVRERAGRLLADGVLPHPRGDYPYPWPLI